MAKSLISNSNLENDFVHSPFHPASVRREDSISATIEIDNKKTTLGVWSYSPFGVTLVSNQETEYLKKGDNLSLKLRINNHNLEYNGVMVGEITETAHGTLIGIRTFYSTDTSDLESNKRESHRWFCPEENLPTGTAANPLQFNDYIFFRIEDFSAGGMRILTSMRNKKLYKGLRLDSTISLPLIGSIMVTLEIVYIEVREVNGKKFIMAGTRFLEKDDTTLSSIAEYLLNFGQDVTIKRLKEEGFKVQEMSKYFDFTYAKTEEDYNEVLKLRFSTYLTAGKLKEGTRVQDMADEHDASSRILMVKFQNELVGTARLTYHETWSTSYYGQYFTSDQFKISARDCVEVTKLCITDTKRGGDVFISILSHLILTSVKSSRRYIIGGATGHLFNFYLEHGFQAANIKYLSTGLNNLQHELIFMDTLKVAKCQTISLKKWYKTFSKVIDFMIEKEILTVSKADFMKINYYKRIGRFLGY